MRDDGAAQTPPLRARIASFAIDLGTLVAMQIGALAVALTILLARTGWGRFDVGLGDAFVATALIGAATPAWATSQLAGLVGHGATAGQRRMDLEVRRPSAARAPVRFLAHPLSAPLWCWLALTALLTGLPWLPALPLLAAAAVTLGGVVSLGMLIVSREARPLHDRLAGTRLVRAS